MAKKKVAAGKVELKKQKGNGTGGTSAPLLSKLPGAECFRCPLKNQNPAVRGEGPLHAKLAVVGEAPGKEEVRVGRPFVGASGQLLDGLLAEVHTPRSTVYVTNAVACFPPGGDMHSFIQFSKKENKGAGIDWHHPVDCCRPRLFRELGIRYCIKCSGPGQLRYEFGPEALLCKCRKPDFVGYAEPHAEPISIEAMGNMALLAMTGKDGITKWRGSALNMIALANEHRQAIWSNVDEAAKAKAKKF